MRAHISTGLRLRRFRGTPTGYAAAGGILVVALLLRAALDPWVTIPFATLFPAVIVAGLIGGQLPGILVMVLGGLISSYLWLLPYGAAQLGWHAAWFNLGLYLATSSIILYLVHALNQALDVIERERDRSDSLFHELQHRTANNLQNASALIRFGMKRAQRDPTAAVDILDSAHKRFETMGRVHRRLYRADGAPYTVARELEELCQDVLAALGSRDIRLSVAASDIELDQDRMLLVSLLVVELMINTVKHAFADGQAGRISIALDRSDTHFTLTYQDDGKGLPAGLDFLASDSLGRRIMQGFISQLGGAMRYGDSRPGALFQISFPVRLAPSEISATPSNMNVIAAA